MHESRIRKPSMVWCKECVGKGAPSQSMQLLGSRAVSGDCAAA